MVKLLPQLSQLWIAFVPEVSLFLPTLDCACLMITGDLATTGAAAAAGVVNTEKILVNVQKYKI